MKVRFMRSDKAREGQLSDAFLEGVRKGGDEVEERRLGSAFDQDCNVVCMVGVKSNELFRQYQKAGIACVYLDKGYSRHSRTDHLRGWEYWRTAVNAHQPTRYFQSFPADRMRNRGWTFEPWRRSHQQSHIVIAGSSEKYHRFYDLRDPTDWAKKLVKGLRSVTRRDIIYRPKPSWRPDGELPPKIDGTNFSDGSRSIIDDLKGAQCLITHGSNACFEAVCSGIPCIVLGDAVAKPISSQTLDAVEKPLLATDAERASWLAFLAYQQWTLTEMQRGDAWKVLRPLVYAGVVDIQAMRKAEEMKSLDLPPPDEPKEVALTEDDE